MRIFRRHPQRAHYPQQRQVQTQRPVATPPTPPAASAAAATTPPSATPQTAAAPAETKEDQATPGFLDNLRSSFSKLSQQANEVANLPPGVSLAEAMKANKGVQLSDEERAQLTQASGVLDRLAGADGMWNRGDLRNNVQQLERSGDLNRAVNEEIGKRWGQERSKRGPLGKALVNAHMNRNYGKYQQQGMGQARQMAQQQLTQGINQAGAKPNAGHDADKAARLGPDAALNAGKPIERKEMEQFQKTMEMLQAKSKEQGLPQVSFPNGVPAGFLQAMKDGKSPQEALKEAGAVITWSNGEKTDYGKPAETKAEPKVEVPPPATPEAATPESTPTPPVESSAESQDSGLQGSESEDAASPNLESETSEPEVAESESASEPEAEPAEEAEPVEEPVRDEPPATEG